MSRSLPCIWLGLILLGTDGAAGAWLNDPASEAPVDFRRDVRPILSNACFPCHGPDEAVREADLRLDLSSEALRDRGGAVAIAPGDPQESLVYQRISDPDDPMPPPWADVQISPREVEILRRWIDQGAQWQEHWAYQRVERPSVPAVDSSWPKNPVDPFVLVRLQERGWQPADRATPETLLRRLSYDLTGLPPALEDLNAYFQDDPSAAYDRAVDRLLDSVHFGEEMAQGWLDAARYGDTHGYHLDNERSLWRYRDWVIEAFNRNLSYDQMTVEQLAGDLLPDPSLSQRIATGFHRCNPTTGEGGLIAEEYLVKYAFDRADTTATVWMGMTLGCAQCHDHKFDPISQREYYQFLAFFSGIDEEASDKNALTPKPALRAPLGEQSAALDQARQAVEKCRQDLEAPDPVLDAAQQQWQQMHGERARRRWQPLQVLGVSATSGTTLSVEAGGVIQASGENPATSTYEVLARLDAQGVSALRLEAFAYEHEDGRLGVGRANHFNIVLTDFEAAVVGAAQPAEFQPVSFTQAFADYSQVKFHITRALDSDPKTGWAIDGGSEDRVAVFLSEQPLGFEGGSYLRLRLRHESGYGQHTLGRFRLSYCTEPITVAEFSPWQVIGPFPAASKEEALDKEFLPEGGGDGVALEQVLDLGDGTQRSWQERTDLVDDQIHSLPGEISATYLYRTIESPDQREVELSLGSDDALRVWCNGELVLEATEPRSVAVDQNRVQLALQEGTNHLFLKLVNFGGGQALYFHRRDEEIYGVPLGIESILAAAADQRNEAQQKKLQHRFRRRNSPEWKGLQSRLQDAEAREAEVLQQIPMTMVMAERPAPRPTHVLMRGQYDQKGDPVSPGVPAILPALPEGMEASRLQLARWLVSREHPLTARVFVNRLWQKLFGVGLVKTSEDFGSQGEFPSHPQLLDWLAAEFMESGWDIKGLLRTLVTSATYQQASVVNPELLARDAENRWLSRGPRFRLDAEAIRDTALAVSGLLEPKIGGRSVKPYQPTGLWKAVGYTSSNTANFVRDSGADLYRRSLYTFWKRTSPPPTLQLFDAPSREACVVRRARTNTPLQALALLNDEQYVEAARCFAERLLQTQAAGDRHRLTVGFRLCTSRLPSESELASLQQVLDGQRAELELDPEAAAQLLEVGEQPVQSDLPTIEVAAWTMVASMLINLHETVTRG